MRCPGAKSAILDCFVCFGIVCAATIGPVAVHHAVLLILVAHLSVVLVNVPFHCMQVSTRELPGNDCEYVTRQRDWLVHFVCKVGLCVYAMMCMYV